MRQGEAGVAERVSRCLGRYTLEGMVLIFFGEEEIVRVVIDDLRDSACHEFNACLFHV